MAQLALSNAVSKAAGGVVEAVKAVSRLSEEDLAVEVEELEGATGERVRARKGAGEVR